MRHWTMRHPNLMTAWWAIVVLWFSFTFVRRLSDERWGWAAVSVVASLGAFDRLRVWWYRT